MKSVAAYIAAAALIAFGVTGCANGESIHAVAIVAGFLLILGGD